MIAAPGPLVDRSRGFALVVVLWTITGLALLGGMVTSTARTRIRLADAATASAMAMAAADGGVHQAIFILCRAGIGGFSRPPVRVRIGEAVVDLTIDDERTRTNPNIASREVLLAVLEGAGLDSASAALLSAEIMDWRTRGETSLLGGEKTSLYRARDLLYRAPNRPFESIEELGLIPDMTPALLARLRPVLSIYNDGDGRPTDEPPRLGTIQAATKEPRGLESADQSLVVRVAAVASIRGRALFARSAVVRVSPGPNNRQGLFQILTWD